MFKSENRLDGDNVELDALRVLRYECTPAEIAQSFKEQRNEKVQMKRWKDAKEYYSKGIAVLAQRKRVRSPRSPDADQSGPVGKKVSLGKVLGSPGVEIVDVVVRINVLLKARAAG